MIKLKNCLYAVLFCSITHTANSQSTEPFGFSFQYTPLDNDDYINQFQAKTLFPLMKAENSNFYTGIGYLQQNISSNKIAFSDNLYSLSIPLIFETTINSKSDLRIFGSISLNSQFNELMADDMIYTLGISYFNYYSNNLRLGYGLAYIRQLFGNQISPILNIDYRINIKWRLEGRLPLDLSISYLPSPKNKIGIQWRLLNNSYGIDHTSTANTYIRNQNASLMLFYERKLIGPIFGKISVGYSNRIYEVYDDKISNWTFVTKSLGDAIAPLDSFENKGAFIEAGINLKL